MRWISSLLWIGIPILSLLFGFFLFRAYPYGIIHPDTTSYLALGQTLSLTHTSTFDYGRTPPFALLLYLSTFTSEPTATVMWVHIVLFTINITLTYWFALGVLRSSVLACVFTSIALVIEITLMRTFYYNTQILADPLLAHLILLGSLLTLGGWIYRTPWVVCAGAGTLGLAAITKPVGIALFPAWILFFLWTIRTAGKHYFSSVSSQVLALLCVTLLLGPTLLWSSRNFVVYRHFRPVASGGWNILPRVLPLLNDTDRILDDFQKNRAFIEEVRALEKEVGTDYNHYAWGSVPNRIGYYGILDPDLTQKWDTIASSQRFFAIDPLAIRTALRIIWLHPREYLTMVFDGYCALFDITRRFSITYQLHALPEETYQGIRSIQEDTRLSLYPPSGFPDTTLISSDARAFLAHLTLIPSYFRLWFLPSFALLTHTLFLWNMGVLWYQRRGKSPAPLHAPVSIIMLFLTAASHYLLASATEDTLDRYTLPGEMGLNIVVLLAFFLILQWLFNQCVILIGTTLPTTRVPTRDSSNRCCSRDIA